MISQSKKGIRTYLMKSYAIGAIPSFAGTVRQVQKNKILVKGLKVRFTEQDGHTVKGKEDHIWLLNCPDVIKSGVQIGDRIEFSAEIYMYKRANRSMDLGLRNPKSFSISVRPSLPQAV